MKDIKFGHCLIQIRPLGVKTGQYRDIQSFGDTLVVATMRLSTDWFDFLSKLDRFYLRQDKPIQLSFDYQGERTEDDGKGL